MAHSNMMMVIVIALLYLWNCNAESKADKPRKDEARLQCEIACEECLPDSVPLKRMGCFEKCIKKGVEKFACPGEQAFLDEVPPIAPAMEEEIQKFFKERSDMFTEQDIDGIINTYTLDSILITDKQMPVIGRDDRRKKVVDYFDANPHLGDMEFTVDVCGGEYDIIWCNGLSVSYNKQGELTTALDFMSLLTHVDGELQEYTVVLFPESKELAEEVAKSTE